MCIQTLLDATSLPTQWHLSYGITEPRKDALLDDNRHADSLFNLNSETALTLFTLGRLDRWVQAGALQTAPRTDNGWNRTLFDNLRNDVSNVVPGQRPLVTPMRRFLAGILGLEPQSLGDAVLMFEFEARNRAFQGGSTFDTLSFLNIAQKWSAFDAVVMVPGICRFVFIESKLGADISRKTKHFPLINQAIRNLESAFFLCNHPDSLYHEWDYRYLVLCPAKEYRYRTTYYSCFFHDIHAHLSLHEEALRNEYGTQVSQERLDQFMATYRRSIPERVVVRHWGQLWELISDDGFRLASYQQSIRDNCGADADVAITAARSRWRQAGVDVGEPTGP